MTYEFVLVVNCAFADTDIDSSTAQVVEEGELCREAYWMMREHWGGGGKDHTLFSSCGDMVQGRCIELGDGPVMGARGIVTIPEHAGTDALANRRRELVEESSVAANLPS